METKRLTPAWGWSSSVYVTGRGNFPLDMLRYDFCYPSSAEDVMKITESTVRTIRLSRVQALRTSGWTPERWSTLGWTLTYENSK